MKAKRTRNRAASHHRAAITREYDVRVARPASSRRQCRGVCHLSDCSLCATRNETNRHERRRNNVGGRISGNIFVAPGDWSWQMTRQTPWWRSDSHVPPRRALSLPDNSMLDHNTGVRFALGNALLVRITYCIRFFVGTMHRAFLSRFRAPGYMVDAWQHRIERYA